MKRKEKETDMSLEEKTLDWVFAHHKLSQEDAELVRDVLKELLKPQADCDYIDISRRLHKAKDRATVQGATSTYLKRMKEIEERDNRGKKKRRRQSI